MTFLAGFFFCWKDRKAGLRAALGHGWRHLWFDRTHKGNVSLHTLSEEKNKHDDERETSFLHVSQRGQSGSETSTRFVKDEWRVFFSRGRMWDDVNFQRRHGHRSRTAPKWRDVSTVRFRLDFWLCDQTTSATWRLDRISKLRLLNQMTTSVTMTMMLSSIFHNSCELFSCSAAWQHCDESSVTYLTLMKLTFFFLWWICVMFNVTNVSAFSVNKFRQEHFITDVKVFPEQPLTNNHVCTYSLLPWLSPVRRMWWDVYDRVFLPGHGGRMGLDAWLLVLSNLQESSVCYTGRNNNKQKQNKKNNTTCKTDLHISRIRISLIWLMSPHDQSRLNCDL